MSTKLKKVAKKKAAPKKARAVKGMSNIWEALQEGYTAYMDPRDVRKTKTLPPYDIKVRIAVPQDEAKHANHSIEMWQFFRRNTMADFKRVTFLSPKVVKKAGRQPSTPKDFLAVFDTTIPDFKNMALQLQRNEENGDVRSSSSRAHCIQLIKMFGLEYPKERGRTVELFLKLTPIKEGEDRESRKICKITRLIRDTEELKEQRKSSK